MLSRRVTGEKNHQLKLIGLVVLIAACGGDIGTQPTDVEGTVLHSRDIPGIRTAIAVTGSMGTGTMDLSAEVFSGPEGGPGFRTPVIGGTFTVEEELCRAAKSNPGHPDGQKCRWPVYSLPDGTLNEFAGEELRNVPNDGPLFILEVPVTILRISYRTKGTPGAEDVLDCPWIPVESLYFCHSDGSVDFLSVEDALRAESVMRRIQRPGH